MTTRDKYVAKMKSEIDDINAQLDKLAAKSKSAKKDMEAKYKQEIADLLAQSSKARAQLGELEAAGEDRWESMIAEMDKISDALKHSYNYFKAQF